MALRRIISKRLKLDSLLEHSRIFSAVTKNSKIPPVPAISLGSVDGNLFRRFLQKREINHAVRLPEFFSIPVGKELREKLKSMNVTGDRIRFESLAPPATVRISVSDAKKILKISQLEKVKTRLREIEMNSISYSEFVQICGEFCSNTDQSLEFVKMLDESGTVIVLGDVVFLRPHQVVEHYKKLIATNVSKVQISHAHQHPRIQYFHTPLSMSNDELLSIFGGENSVDLITVAIAVHWFDLPRKPGGIIAVWGYATMNVSPEFDPKLKSFLDSTHPYWHPNLKFVLNEYKTLSFPFESVGLGSESEPIQVDIQKEISFEGFLGWLKSWSVVNSTKEGGVDLLSQKLVKEFEVASGGPKFVRSVVYKAFMLVGKAKI